jgi:MarR family transcriptional regulator, lower aerobic nicotinate degradation pathway regulator
VPTAPHPGPRREDVADSLSRVAPLVTRWTERLLAAHDPPLTPAQYGALQAMAGGDAHGADLARQAGVSAAAVSQLLSGLQGAGLIERGARGGDDRRRQSLSLTPAGAAALESARALLRERLAGLLEDLPPPEVDALGRSLPRLEAILGGTAPPPRPARRPPPPPPGGPRPGS